MKLRESGTFDVIKGPMRHNEPYTCLAVLRGMLVVHQSPLPLCQTSHPAWLSLLLMPPAAATSSRRFTQTKWPVCVPAAI